MESGRKMSKNFKKKVSKNSKSSKLGRTKSGKLKVLPPIDKIGPHLSDYGYTLSKPESVRKASLKRASNKEGTLKVLRRLNLIRNYTAVESNKKKMNKDMEFIKSQCAKEKKNIKH
jgi:hypothetical protein